MTRDRAHGHSHGAALGRAGARHRDRLWWALGLVVVVLAVQLVVGVATGSLALLSDAGHMATDALGLGMALAAIIAADRASRARHRTFGLYRLEILAALANAVLLLGVAAYVLVEAARRLSDPPAVASAPVLAVGVLGLAANVVALLLLRRGAGESINVRGAYLEVAADALGSFGVIVSAVLSWSMGWRWADPVVGAAIGLFVVPRSWRLGREAMRVLVQAAPKNVDVEAICEALAAVAGVDDVHDVHVWTLTSDMDVVTAHLGVAESADTRTVLRQARQVLADDFHLGHATLQIEGPGDCACDQVAW